MTDIVTELPESQPGYLQDPQYVVVSWPDGTPEPDQAGLSENDALEFLGTATTGTNTVPLTAAAETHTGAMIALIPSETDLERLVVLGGEPGDQMHVTLCYLGQAADWSPETRVELEDTMSRYTQELAPIEAEGFAVALFNPPGTERADDVQRDMCAVLLCSGDSLAVVHSFLWKAIRDVIAATPHGQTLPAQHQPWIPHITLAYTDDLTAVEHLADRTGPVTFDRVRVAFGGDNYDIELRGTLVAAGVEAAFWKKAEHPRNPKDGEFIDNPAGGVTDAVKKALDEQDAVREMMNAHARALRPKIEDGSHPFLQKAHKANMGMDAYETPRGSINDLGADGRKYAHVETAQRVNAALRAGHTPSADDQRVVDALDSAMTRSTAPTLLFRGVGDGHKMFGDRMDGDMTGLTFTDKGFGSTSADQKFPGYLREGLKQTDPVEMRILAGAETSMMKGSGKAHEVILGRGQRYKVVRDRGVIDGVRHLDLEISGPDALDTEEGVGHLPRKTRVHD